MVERISRLLEQLKEQNHESILVTSKANVFYLSGYYTDPHERLVGVYADHIGNPVLILPQMEKADAIKSGWTSDILGYDDQTNPWKLLASYLQGEKRLPSNVAVERDHFTLERQEFLQTALPNVTLSGAEETLRKLRLIKDQKELVIMKQAASLADFGVETGIKALAEGKTELEIVAEIEFALKKQGVREMSFSTLVLTGENTASPHGNPGQNKIKAGDMVLFDLGVVYQGYCSDITRTVAFKKVNEKQKEIYNTVLYSQIAAIQKSQVGTPAGDIDKAARAVITEAGYGEYFTHRVGHGIGVDVHEYPSMNSENTLKLTEGMSYTIEPGIYVPNVGGVRIEDEIFITKKGPELLTKHPKELQIIE